MHYKGEIVIAGNLDVTSNSIYKLRGSIRTGSQKGKECSILHKGSIDTLTGTEIVIRLDDPERKYLEPGQDEKSLYGNFVTSKLPEGFEHASSDQVILYGIWLQLMEKGFSVPTAWRVEDIYDIGKNDRVLHYEGNTKIVVPHNLFRGYRPEIPTVPPLFRYRMTNIEALSAHLNKVAKRENPGSPNVVTVGEKISLESMIIPLFDQIIQSDRNGIQRHIQMEPQL